MWFEVFLSNKSNFQKDLFDPYKVHYFWVIVDIWKIAKKDTEHAALLHDWSLSRGCR